MAKSRVLRKAVLVALSSPHSAISSRGGVERALCEQGISTIEASSALQAAIDDGVVFESIPGYVQKSGYFRRLWSLRPWKPAPPTADHVLATMIPISQIPPRKAPGVAFSLPCHLGQLREDGSLLVHGEMAVYHFLTGEWREWHLGARRGRLIDFSATHYAVAGAAPAQPA